MKNSKGAKPESYKPLVVILLAALVAALAINHISPVPLMHIFMGMFFVIFSMFKFFDLAGFVEGFSMYDLIAKNIPAYGYLYPFIELALGLSYLSNFSPIATDSVTIVVMFISAAGVIRALGQGMDVRCACLGTTLNVPLSTVSIIENIGMGVMAIYAIVTM